MEEADGLKKDIKEEIAGDKRKLRVSMTASLSMHIPLGFPGQGSPSRSPRTRALTLTWPECCRGHPLYALNHLK